MRFTGRSTWMRPKNIAKHLWRADLSTTIGGWSDEEGEYSNQIGMFEIDGERLIVQERGPSLRGLRETLFFIIYKALLNGKFGKLRRCKKCGKFCVPPKGGDHCSEFCRRASSNKERANANYFANKYVTNKKSRLDGAKARFLQRAKEAKHSIQSTKR